jgi:glycosyltransferase involved in cell wall biosynthesis
LHVIREKLKKAGKFMRVCHIWQNFIPIEFGGVERYILNLSDFLSNRDHDMNFIMITDKAAYVPFSLGLRTSRCQRINSLEVHRLGPNLSSFLRGVLYITFHRSSKTLDKTLATELFNEAANIRGIDEVDVFHIHGLWQPLYPTIGLLLSEHFHRPFVVTLHGDSVNVNDPFAMPIRTPAIVEVLRRAEFITTYSEETLNVLRELGLGKTTRLIPNFVNTKLFRRPTTNGTGSGNRVVMVSRLSKPKDPMTPIRAFGEVIREVPEATFKIVGYGPLYETASRLVQDLNLGRKVTMVGMKSDVRPFLWESDISIGTRGSYITTLEAWAAGLPVIAPNFGIMKEIISNGKDGLLVEPGNVHQLANAMIDLIRNKDLRAKIVANGEDTVKKHDIQNVASSIEHIYSTLLRE